MPWIKLDDNFFQHPKILGIPAEAKLLYLAGLCWAGANLTDGIIPAAALPLLAVQANLTEANAKQIAKVLLKQGLWESSATAPDVYIIHDFLAYQQSRAQAQATAAVRAEAGRKGGSAPRRPKTDPREPSEALDEASTKQIASDLLQQRGSKTKADPIPSHVDPLTPSSTDVDEGARALPTAVQVYKDAAQRTPRRSTWPIFDERLGAAPTPEALAALRRAVTLWTGSGYNVTNISGILDWTEELIAGREPVPLGKKKRRVKAEPAGFQALRDAGLDLPKDDQ